jgi:hypothetical protein
LIVSVFGQGIFQIFQVVGRVFRDFLGGLKKRIQFSSFFRLKNDCTDLALNEDPRPNPIRSGGTVSKRATPIDVIDSLPHIL